MEEQKIIFELKENVGIITLNNPAKMNCMGFQLLHELNEVIVQAENEDGIKVVVIKGAGERAFSTGADLTEFKSLSDEKAAEWIEFGNTVFNRIENFKKPTVALINGYALGGGLELALACDFRVGTKTTTISCPELSHGWLPGWGGMVRLRRLIGEVKAKELIMLCDKINAKEALHLGLINKIDSMDGEKFKGLVKHLTCLNSQAFALAKTALRKPNRTTYGEDIQFDIQALQITK